MRRARLGIVLLLLLFGCGRRGPPPRPEFTIAPYLQRPGQTEMTVQWASGSSRGCIVRYATGGEADKELAAPPFDSVPVEPPEHLYRARLEGLRPGAVYRYTVACGASEAGGTFRTVPDKSEPFRFAAYGDSRTWPEVHRRVACGIAAEQPAFIIHTGDMVESGAYAEWPEQFFGPLGDVIRGVPLWLARGNHDGTGQLMLQLFALPNGKLYYSFDYGNAHFVCLDSEVWRSLAAMLQWCEKDLAASKATWKFVFYHCPSYDFGHYGSDWGRTDFLPLFRKHGVDFVIAGHTHSYQRTRPMFTPGENEAHPITHIVTAGGGAPLYRVTPDAYAAAAQRVHHFTVFDIDGETLSLRALTPDGAVIDSLKVTKTGGAFNKEYLEAALPETTFGKERDK